LMVYERNASFCILFLSSTEGIIQKSEPLFCILFFSYGTVNELIFLTNLSAKIFHHTMYCKGTFIVQLNAFEKCTMATCTVL
jgi:hypothetical protein